MDLETFRHLETAMNEQKKRERQEMHAEQPRTSATNLIQQINEVTFVRISYLLSLFYLIEDNSFS